MVSCRLCFPTTEIGYLAFAYDSEHFDTGMTSVYQTMDGGETWDLFCEIKNSAFEYFMIGEEGNGFLSFADERYTIENGIARLNG